MNTKRLVFVMINLQIMRTVSSKRYDPIIMPDVVYDAKFNIAVNHETARSSYQDFASIISN